jgi:hypothetical protein
MAGGGGGGLDFSDNPMRWTFEGGLGGLGMEAIHLRRWPTLYSGRGIPIFTVFNAVCDSRLD